MRFPVTIEELREEWAKDSVIDKTEIGLELLKISVLHQKYLTILSHHSLIVKKLGFQYAQQRKFRTDYLSGKLNNPDDLAKYKLEPQLTTIHKPDMPAALDADESLIAILAKKALNEEIVSYCTLVMKELHSRTFQLRSYLDWLKWQAGNG